MLSDLQVDPKNDAQGFEAKISYRGPILLFQGCFETRITSRIQLSTLKIPIQNLKDLKNVRADVLKHMNF